MTRSNKPRVDALQYLTHHYTSSLKPIFDACPLPVTLSLLLERSKHLVRSLIYAGALKVELRNFGPEPPTVLDEIFVTLNDPLPKSLMVHLVKLDADEFDEIEPNVFRLWWH